ncbi:hypothetical protein NHQ30_000002 [Ciborinia camelliae]|nr:hypothetical protein NHQ30_000002 [Ciborinia camelliae]
MATPPLPNVAGGLANGSASERHMHVAINYRKAPLNETDFGGDGKIVWDGAVPGGSPYDLLLNVAATSDWTFVSLITQHNLYEASDGAFLLKWYTRALEALARDSCVEIRKCQISNETDIMEVIELGRGDTMEVPWKGTSTDRINEVAAKLPEDIAIIDDQGQNLTYAQMTSRIIEITRRLQGFVPPLSPGLFVAMLLYPIPDAICCILAIMRLGLVWIPLDTRNHQQRLRAVVDESLPQVLVCHNLTKDLEYQISAGMNFTSLLSIDDNDDNKDENKDKICLLQDAVKYDSDNRSDQPAIILYTSGSTGAPKGVVPTHVGLLNQIYGTSVILRLRRETTLQQSPLGFDLMLDQIFLPLCNGGTIVMVAKSARGEVAELIFKYNVTLTHFVPHGAMLFQEGKNWLVNVYGPAEITLAYSRGIVPYREMNGIEGSSDHLRPSPNYALEITDADMNILPVGFPGEICISGHGLGPGYIKQHEESGRKFTYRKSTSTSSSETGIYRSGDQGRILPDGTLKVLGRLDGDSQVKIHGFRVELDEISNAIVHVSNGTIVNAAVSWRPGQPSGILVAFVVFDVKFNGDKSQFVEWLRSNIPLPQVMKPNFIVPTDRIPATANGKIDKGAVDKLPLPEPLVSCTTNPLTRSLSPWEQSIKEVWEEVLSPRTVHISGHKQVTIQHNSDFFDVGGNSILLIKLKYLLKVQFGVKISMPELFHSSSLSRMATIVQSASNTANKAALSPMTESFLEPRGALQMINWDLEIASMVHGLPQPKIIPSLLNQRLSKGNEGIIVVLTGATGFIGRNILSHLVQNPKVAKVHCLSMRPDAFGKPRHVSIKSNKIFEYVGDLSNLNHGLLDSQFAFLAQHAHVIIHNGADVSRLKTYQSLRRANVLSTRTLCDTAIPPLYYISTASVAKVMQHGPLLETASKWASEALLQKAAVNNGLPAYVHRLAHVVGDDASELDAIGMLTKYSLMLHALPQIEAEDVKGKWDFVLVEDLSRDLVELVIESVVGGGTSIRLQHQTQQNLSAVFTNHCNHVKVSHNQLKAYFEGMAGESFRDIEIKEWLAAARERGFIR